MCCCCQLLVEFDVGPGCDHRCTTYLDPGNTGVPNNEPLYLIISFPQRFHSTPLSGLEYALVTYLALCVDFPVLLPSGDGAGPC